MMQMDSDRHVSELLPQSELLRARKDRHGSSTKGTKDLCHPLRAPPTCLNKLINRVLCKTRAGAHFASALSTWLGLTTMAGPNLELFKFSLYLFFPLAIMVHYGDPQWYHDNVLPFRNRFWPEEESLYVSRQCSMGSGGIVS